MKRTPFKRRSPMRRSGARRSKYRRRERSTDYMLAVKRLPCAALIVAGHVCSGEVEADHAGRRGVGRKAHDSTVIPMCQQAHRDRDAFAGAFRGWDQARMRDFLAGRIIQTQRFMRARGWTIQTTDRDIQETVPPAPRELVYCARCGADPCVCDELEIVRVRFTERMEDLREDGDIDVRNPEAALAASLVEGDR